MQTNPYEDEMPLAWIPQENQFYERESDKIRSSQVNTPLQYQSGQRNMQDQKPKPEQRMPKAQAEVFIPLASHLPLRFKELWHRTVQIVTEL